MVKSYIKTHNFLNTRDIKKKIMEDWNINATLVFIKIGCS